MDFPPDASGTWPTPEYGVSSLVIVLWMCSKIVLEHSMPREPATALENCLIV